MLGQPRFRAWQVARMSWTRRVPRSGASALLRSGRMTPKPSARLPRCAVRRAQPSAAACIAAGNPSSCVRHLQEQEAEAAAEAAASQPSAAAGEAEEVLQVKTGLSLRLSLFLELSERRTCLQQL